MFFESFNYGSDESVMVSFDTVMVCKGVFEGVYGSADLCNMIA